MQPPHNPSTAQKITMSGFMPSNSPDTVVSVPIAVDSAAAMYRFWRTHPGKTYGRKCQCRWESSDTLAHTASIRPGSPLRAVCPDAAFRTGRFELLKPSSMILCGTRCGRQIECVPEVIGVHFVGNSDCDRL